MIRFIGKNAILNVMSLQFISSSNYAAMNRNRQEVLKNAASHHRDSLRKSLQHRLEIARAKGNEQLVRELEAEASYLGMN